jgi:hypothetical protein
MIGLVFFYQGKTLLFAIEIINGMQLRVNTKAFQKSFCEKLSQDITGLFEKLSG